MKITTATDIQEATQAYRKSLGLENVREADGMDALDLMGYEYAMKLFEGVEKAVSAPLERLVYELEKW